MKTPLPISSRRRTNHAFTLIELLTVIAVIAVLASILIPTVNGARKSALAAKSRGEFAQIAQACVQFRSAYGFWPCNSGDSLESGSIVKVLRGEESGDSPKNKQKVSFYNPTSLTADGKYVIDAFGNSDIRIVFANLNGKIPTVSIDNTTLTTGNPYDNASSRGRLRVGNHPDIYAKVAVFSAGDGKNVVGSWSD